MDDRCLNELSETYQALGTPGDAVASGIRKMNDAAMAIALFEIYRGYGNSNNAQYSRKNSRLRMQVARNISNSITVASSPGSSSFTSTGAATLTISAPRGDNRMYVIEVIAGGLDSKVAVRRSKQVYTVPFNRLSTKFQEIHKTGSKIVNVMPTQQASG